MSSKNLADIYESAKPGGSDGFEPLPVGTYRTAVSSAGWTVSSKGTPGFKVELTVQEGEYSNRKIWDYVWLSPNNASISLERLIAYGTSHEAVVAAIRADLDDSPAVAAVCRDLIDSAADVTIKHEEYQGKTQTRVKGVVPVDADPLASVQGVAAAPAAAARPTTPF
jgi:Protein of unknown function (DUF669)